MVDVETGTPGRGGPLPQGNLGSQTRRALRAEAARGHRDRFRGGAPHEGQWALVSPLLPPQRGVVGRPRNDHRVVLGSMLWVARTGSSWREMPEEYGEWETVYRRHELWTKQGLWHRILRALGEEDPLGPATKKPN